MIVVKCKCGCHFTLKNEAFLSHDTAYTCQNCGRLIHFHPQDYLQSTLSTDDYEFYTVPDNSVIRFDCNL
jgi:hypothetical protein